MKSRTPQVQQRSQAKDRWWTLLFGVVVLTFCFLYALLRLDPRLIYQAQQPVFFFDAHFLRDFLAFPGGVNAVLSACAGQLFYRAWTGALLLAVLFGLIAWNTQGLVSSIDRHGIGRYLFAMPPAFLLALHSNYRFPLALSLGLLWTLVCTNAFLRLAPARPVRRGGFYLALWAGLYYVAAGQTLVFAGLVVLYEALVQRRIASALLYAALAALLPYVATATLFAMHVPDAYTTNLTSFATYKASWLLWTLYAFFPMTIVALILVQWRLNILQTKTEPHRPKQHPMTLGAIQGVVVLCLTVGAALLSYDARAKTILRVDYHARRGEWEQVLKTAGQGVIDSYLVLYQANRALYHCGLLGDRMFGLPQYAGVNGLFMPVQLRNSYPLQYSDVFLDLDLVNEAQHWAHEAVCVTGDAPWNLQQLALTNLLKNDRIVATKYLGMLRRTVWHKAWADEGLKLLAENEDVSTCPRFRETKACMPTTDFLVSPVAPERCLEPMQKNARNKMAFEYYMASCLLQGDLSGFITHLGRLGDLGYTRVPRHYEEAILIYMELTKQTSLPVPGLKISSETVQRFRDFNRIFTQHNKNKEAALGELRQYADTYWFYAQYYFHPEGS